jgi:uncharacterized sulfatase
MEIMTRLFNHQRNEIDQTDFLPGPVHSFPLRMLRRSAKGSAIGYSDDSRSEPVFFSRPPDRKSFYGFEKMPDLAMREGEWKFLCDYDGSRPELYNIILDPGESNNLANTNKEIAESMKQRLIDWWEQMPEL